MRHMPVEIKAIGAATDDPNIAKVCLQETFGCAKIQHIRVERDAADMGERFIVQELVGVDHRRGFRAMLPHDLQWFAVHIVLEFGLMHYVLPPKGNDEDTNQLHNAPFLLPPYA